MTIKPNFLQALRNNLLIVTCLITTILISNDHALASTQPYITDHQINFGTGNKYLTQTDVNLPGAFQSLKFTRTYNSQSDETSSLGHGWKTSGSEKLTIETDTITLIQSGGRHVTFTGNNTDGWTNKSGKTRTIIQTTTGYQLIEPNQTVKNFNANGNLTEKKDRNNNTTTYTYTNNKLNSITDAIGRTLSFTYQNDQPINIVTPIGTFTYTYDGNNNLISVQKPDTTTIQYIYDDPNDIHNLTGIINELNIRTLTVAYDNQDRAINSSFADGSQAVQIDYTDTFQRTITSTKGVQTTYELEVKNGIVLVKSFIGPGCAPCGGDDSSEYVTNDRQQVIQKTDAKGIITTYEYDTDGNRIKKTEAVGTAEERITNWSYEPTTNRVLATAKASASNPGQSKVTSMSYDGNGNMLSRTESGFSNTQSISRTNTYNYDGYGRISSINGPRSDVNDVVAIDYYGIDPSLGNNAGNLQNVTNALNQTVTYDQYNVFGRAERITDAGGRTTTISYNSRGLVTQRTTAGITTSYLYDGTGQLTQISLPVTFQNPVILFAELAVIRNGVFFGDLPN